jgi:hypothetical protein
VSGLHGFARTWRAAFAALVLCAGPTGCAAPVASSAGGDARTLPSPATRAERTNYLETSRYADVVAFLDSLKAMGAPYAFGSIGKTFEGREIPYVIASRPLVHNATEARAAHKPIAYVQANIHAGEVEGKEALQALLRDLAFAKGPNVLDSIILVAVPIYNADGNERFGPQERQRTEQNGPELVGQRPNAQGLDLNRDYVKAEAPETRASLAMFNAWEPDVFVDLHTTDGSFHGYALTYSPSLNPAAPLGDYTRELLAELRKRVRDREGYETFDYGNFSDAFGNEVGTDTVHAGWYTYDHRPRFGTNYFGLRNGISVLSEAYSHDPFERRVKSTYAFTKQLLSLVAENRVPITERTRAPRVVAGDTMFWVPLRSTLPPRALPQKITFEVLARTGDSARTQPGVPRGLRRTGEYRTRSMPVFDRFVPALGVRQPYGYLVDPSDTAIVARFWRHGIRASEADRSLGQVEEFVVDSIVRSPRPFQGHNEVRLVGRWRRTERCGLGTGSSLAPEAGRACAAPGTGMLFVQVAGRPLAALAMYLLDPESDDSFATWNLLDDRLRVGQPYPVLRVPDVPTAIR